MAEPDFKAFAAAWIRGDSRLRDLVRDDPEAAERLAARLAEALARRRQGVSHEEGGNLFLRIHPSRFDDQGRLDQEAMDELFEAFREVDEADPEP